ncbi:lipocalin family protein [Jongsikchunia kroppenstedtii]|uniref:lipocalin family protein n=1 Tax=Jongsikchunia kroppenstedtii TaxID=1121721 RepID=UPI00035C60ED|nr:lipocalin family protein [Jongsikchunia kroppenstedtii]
MKKFAHGISLAAALAVVAAIGAITAPAATAQPPAPVAALQLPRYLGTWHQLAAVPAYFNLVCARDTQAHYALDPHGNISVRNRCTTWSNTPNTITGTATVNDATTHAQLHVSFPGVPTQEQLHGPTNYVVVGLATDYSWAVVTDPYRVSGFVLSRTPALTTGQWQRVRAAITGAGLSTCVFLTSPTTGGIDVIRPVCSG